MGLKRAKHLLMLLELAGTTVTPFLGYWQKVAMLGWNTLYFILQHKQSSGNMRCSSMQSMCNA